MAGSSRRITVEFIGDAASLTRAGKDGEAALTGFSSKAQATGKIAGKVLAGGLLLAGAAAISATKAAAEDEAAQVALANTLKNTTGATSDQVAGVEDWIAAQGKATGITDDELRPAMARLATATGDVASAQRLASQAMNISAGTGQSLETVTKAIQRGLNGNVSSLGKLGVATKDASGHTKRFEDIMADLSQKHMNAAAKAAETTAGKQKILSTQFGELQEQIGAKLLPVMVKLSEVGLKMVTWISQNTTLVGTLVAAFAGLLAITYAVGVATKAFAAIQTVFKAVTVAATAVQWLLNAALTANPIGLVIVAIAALVAGLILAYKHSETFRAIVDAAFSAVKDVVLGAITAITAAVGAVIDFIRDHWQLLLGILTGPIGAAVILIISHWDTIKTKTTEAWDAVKTVVGNKIDAFMGFITAIPGAIKAGLATLTGDVRDIFDGAMTAAKNKVENIGGTIVTWITGIPAKIGALASDFKQVGKDLITAFINGLAESAGFVSQIAGNVWDALKGMINTAIRAINAALSFSFDTHIPGVGTVHIDPPDIPQLAKGGIVTRPTLALIGEAGPEAVVPLNRRNTPNMGGGGGTVNIYLQSLDPRGAGKAVVDALREYERQTGRQYVVSPA